MRATPQACEMKAACCCQESEAPAGRGYSRCTMGKRVAGILDTDPSWLIAKEKNEKTPLPSFLSGPGNALAQLENLENPPAACFAVRAHPTVLILPSLFLLDCTFRI